MKAKHWKLKSPHVKCPHCGELFGVEMWVSRTKAYRIDAVAKSLSAKMMKSGSGSNGSPDEGSTDGEDAEERA
jgi:hypothetical protein